MKPGYLYVLMHPSDPNLYKIGVTVLDPEKRLAQHNRQLDMCACRIVKETGQKWEIKTYISVPDPYWAEKAFWGATHFPNIPYRGGVEIERMEWSLVESGLMAATKAGVRPPPPDSNAPVRDRDWMLSQLEGSGITMVGRYSGMIRTIRNGQFHVPCWPSGYAALPSATIGVPGTSSTRAA